MKKLQINESNDGIDITNIFEFKENGTDLKNDTTDKIIDGFQDFKKNYYFIKTSSPELHPTILKYFFFFKNFNEIKDKLIKNPKLIQQEKNNIEHYLNRTMKMVQ